jgi:hypothetical protein
MRIELEQVLRALAEESEIEDDRPLGITRLVRELAAREEIPEPIVEPLLEVLQLAIRAVHGEAVRRSDAETIVALGVRILDELWDHYADIYLKPTSTEPVKWEEIESAREQRYLLTTLVPVINSPVRNVRVVDQVKLDQFFDGYGEFAEFVVALEPAADVKGPPVPQS